MPHRLTRRIALFSPCLVGLAGLTACGGSSSSPPPPPSVTSFPVAAAINAYAQASHTYNLTASANGVNFTAALTFTPGSSATFENQTTSTATQTVNIMASNGTSASGTDTSYFVLSPFKFVGDVITAGTGVGRYSVYANQVALPATAMLGASGSLDTETTYTDSTKMTVHSTSIETWNLSQATSSTGWLCDNVTATPAGGGSAANSSQCYQVDASGNVLTLKIVVQVNGQSVTFQ
jgi:hypothetical protein